MGKNAVTTTIYPEAWRNKKAVSRQDATENQVSTIVRRDDGTSYIVRLRVSKNGAVSLVLEDPNVGRGADVTLYRGNVNEILPSAAIDAMLEDPELASAIRSIC